MRDIKRKAYAVQFAFPLVKSHRAYDFGLGIPKPLNAEKRVSIRGEAQGRGGEQEGRGKEGFNENYLMFEIT